MTVFVKVCVCLSFIFKFKSQTSHRKSCRLKYVRTSDFYLVVHQNSSEFLHRIELYCVFFYGKFSRILKIFTNNGLTKWWWKWFCTWNFLYYFLVLYLNYLYTEIHFKWSRKKNFWMNKIFFNEKRKTTAFLNKIWMAGVFDVFSICSIFCIPDVHFG